MAEMPKEQVVHVRAELDNAVMVRPGDKLVIGIAGSITATMAREMKDRLAERLPDIDIVIIDNTAGFAVYRPEPHYEELPGDPPWKKEAEQRKQARINGELP